MGWVTRRVLEGVELIYGHVWLLSRGYWLVADTAAKKFVDRRLMVDGMDGARLSRAQRDGTTRR